MDRPAGQASVGDSFPPDCAILEVHVGEMKQMFDAMDPAPFRERDLDPKAEEYIVGWSREIAPARPFGLIVHLSRQQPTPADADMLRAAVREYFRQRAVSTRRELRQLLRVGRKSLLIGLFVLAVALIIGERIAELRGRYGYGDIVGHSLLIGGWVALWRPLEIFLYDWWPIRADALLYDRLGEIFVRLQAGGAPSDAAPTGAP
jgi:hypothetical protein